MAPPAKLGPNLQKFGKEFGIAADFVAHRGLVISEAY